jgi:galactose mutarotase-like enzyme
MWDDAQIMENIKIPITIKGNNREKIGSGVKFTRTSNDMEEGFPGKLKTEVSFMVTSDNELYLNWKAWLVEG